MITVYASDAEDFSGNGLCVLYPTTCPVEEVAGGIYDLEINHPMSEDGRWLFLQKGNLIKTLVPKRDTPLIQQSAEARPEHPEHIVWHVTAASGSKLYTQASTGYSSWSNAKTYTKGAKVNYSGKSYRWDSEIAGNATPPNASWKKITTGSKVQKKLKLGDEMIYLEAKDSTWSHVTVSDGTSGYIQTNTIAYLRTEPYMSAQPAYNTAVPPKRIRDQVFRIYDVTTDTEQHSVKALARHIFYDQRGNFVKTYNPAKASLQAALIAMSADLLNDHEFNYYTNLIAEISAEWALKNGVQVILDPEQGAAVKCSAQVVRDNYDVFLLENTGVNRGVVIESGKNLLGVVSNINDDNVVTRIMPYGTDIGGKMLLLPELHIDSQYIDNYPNDRAIPLQVPEAVEKAPSDDDPGMTKEQCYEKMRQAVQSKYDAGCDLPDFDIKVNFVQLGDTEEYKAYRELHRLYLYDIVTVKHGRLGLNYKAQVIGFVWDAAKKRYTGMTLGNVKSGADLGMIAGFQLPIGGISGTKLVPGSIGSMQLRELSVLAAHIGLAQIVNAHIQDATIDKAKVKDFAAEVAAIAVAKIGEAWIDTAWIGKLTAEVVDIVTAHIGTVIADSATINWAQIANLTAAVTDIVLAKIQTANIGWAQIIGLTAETALFTQGASGKLYCADFMATDANIESLSANKIAGGMATFGKLMLMGQDGKLYEINVGSLGEVTASEKQLDGDNVGDYVLTDRNIANGTLTARTLNVQDIFANSILVRQLISQNIDTDTLFANSAYTNRLRTHLIESDIGAYLNLQSNTGIQALVSDKIREISVAGINLIRESWQWKTAFWAFAIPSDGAYAFGAYGTSPQTLFLVGGTALQSVVYQVNLPAKANMQYVFSAEFYTLTGVGAVCRVVEGSDSQAYLATHSLDPASKDVVFTTLASTTKFAIEIIAAPGTYLFVGPLKLAQGNKAGWTPAPEDTDNAIATAMAQITPEKILLWIQQGTNSKVVLTALQALIESDSVLINTLAMSIVRRDASGNVYLSIGDTGLSTEYPIASPLILSPSVLGVYLGPAEVSYAGGIQQTIDNVAKYLKYDVSIAAPAGGHYGNVTIEDRLGKTLTLNLNGTLDIYASLIIRNNQAKIRVIGNMWRYCGIRPSSGNIGLEISNNKCVDVQYLRITGKARANASDGLLYGIFAADNASLNIADCISECTRSDAVVISKSTGVVTNLVGGQPGGGYSSLANLGSGLVVADGSSIAVKNTTPIGESLSKLSWYATAPGMDSAVPTASPGAAPGIPSTQVLRYTLLEYGTLRRKNGQSSWVWFTSDYIWQADNDNDYDSRIGVIILNDATNMPADIAGRTILSMRLTLQRHTAYGLSGTSEYRLHYHAYTSKGGISSGTATRPVMVDTAIRISLERGETKTIDLPSSLFALVSNGTLRGFGNLNGGHIVALVAACTLEIVVQN